MCCLGGIKTGAKRKRLRKCDIEKAKGKQFFILRALQVVRDLSCEGEDQISREKSGTMRSVTNP